MNPRKLKPMMLNLHRNLPLKNLLSSFKSILVLAALLSLYLILTYIGKMKEAEPSILWYTKLGENYQGSQGFIEEAFSFMIPLSSMLDFGWYSGSSLADVRTNKFFANLSEDNQKILQDLFIQGSKIDHAFPQDNKVISIVFDQPSQYENIFDSTRLKYSAYKVGRAMFETNWIPNNWEYYINEYLDELWVPSNFAKKVFESAGIFKPIYVIKEGFDPKRFDRSLDIQERHAYRKLFYSSCLESDVIFLSVGKMERRKGIDILANTFKNAFKDAKNGGNVCLYIRAEMNEKQRSAIKTFNQKGLRIYVMDRLSNEDLILAYQRY